MTWRPSGFEHSHGDGILSAEVDQPCISMCHAQRARPLLGLVTRSTGFAVCEPLGMRPSPWTSHTVERPGQCHLGRLGYGPYAVDGSSSLEPLPSASAGIPDKRASQPGLALCGRLARHGGPPRPCRRSRRLPRIDELTRDREADLASSPTCSLCGQTPEGCRRGASSG